jgi:hypothetical protein
MKYRNYFLILVVCVIPILSFARFDYVKHVEKNQDFNLFQYQDCYKTIMPLLNRYERAFTVLDLDAHLGYYSFNIVHDYNAICVMVEEKQGDILAELCDENILGNRKLMVLKKKLSHDELIRLSECEHFDVILALHGIPETDTNARETLNTILKLGDHIITKIQAPQQNLKAQRIYDLARDEKGQLLATLKDKNDNESLIFLFSKQKTQLKRKYWTFKRLARSNTYTINSTFTEKTMKKKQAGSSNVLLPWEPGINLLTFKTLNGIYPFKETIREQLEPFSSIKHTDLHIWNVIIQGHTLIPIDGNDRTLHYNPKFTLQKIMEQFKKRFLSFT